MKKLLTAFAALVISFASFADEGMWLPSMINSVIGDMQAKGFRLSAEDVYSVNQASLKDAVLLFGGGCTGEMISPKGLLITNHHCGYSYIQRHSSVEHDYLKDGFWAMNQGEELPCPGLSVSFLQYMEDVTATVLKGYKEGMTEAQREAIVAKNSKAIIDKAVKGGVGLRAQVSALYYGNQYFLYVFQTYKDVRFVGAPPSSIGKFGGETDNWIWPRHTGDFSMFRVYADKNNQPAEYSEDNVPYVPKKFFEISTAGVNEGDFTFVYGCPGSTREYITAEPVRFNANVSNPVKIGLRTLRLETMQEHMAKDQAVRIQYSSKASGVANAWKKWQGEAKGIIKMKTVDSKKAYEARFKEWAKGTKYEGVVEQLDSLQLILNEYTYASENYSESISAIEWPAYARRANKDSASFYKDYYQPIDEQIFDKVVTAYGKNMEGHQFRNPYYDQKMAQYESVEAWRKAVFASEAEAKEFGDTFYNYNRENVQPTISAINKQISLLMRTYMKGQMEFEPNKVFYPDANMTLRIAYGKVAGYKPADAIYYTPVSTLDGVIEKDNPNIFDYDIPQTLRDIHATKDYGRWAVNGTVPVCFLATNHTSGGNSGSPVINADGRLIGVNFDRVWEGTMSDVVFDPEFCRNISIDIRYALFVIDKIGGASYLFNEMVLVP